MKICDNQKRSECHLLMTVTTKKSIVKIILKPPTQIPKLGKCEMELALLAFNGS